MTVDQAEDRGVRAYAERERQDSRDREGFAARERSKRIAQIAAYFVQPREAEALSRLLFVFLNRSEFQPRPPPRFVGRETVPLDEILGAP
jgi:hypothetical protein